MSRFPKYPRHLLSALALSTLITTALPSNAETRVWSGTDNAQWITPENWQEGARPGPDDIAHFKQNTGGETIIISEPTEALSLQVHRGKDLKLIFEGEGTLKTTEQNNIGVDSSGSGAASLTITRAEGSTGTILLNLSRIYLGSHSNTADGNSLLISGAGLRVTTTGNPTGQLIVGARKQNHSATISDGAQLTVKNATIAQSSSITGNKILVTGKDSLLKTQGVFIIGGSSSSTTYGAGANNNFLHLSDGGSFEFYNSDTEPLFNSIKLGSAGGAHSNYILIEGQDSELRTNRTIQIGNNTSQNFGGNRVEIRDNGSLNTSSNVFIYGYQDDAAQNDGANKLLIGKTASFTQSGATVLEVHRGALLRLEAGGVLSGSNIKIQGGRFEAAGSGLQTSGSVEITEDGVLAVSSPDEGPAVLSISSTVQFTSSSLLELRIFDHNLADHITFENNGHFLVGEETILRISLSGYTVKAGDSWVLFNGLTSNIHNGFSNFELPSIDDGLSWDTSLFNQENGWQLRVIPEPSVIHSAWIIMLALIFASGGRKLLSRTARANN